MDRCSIDRINALARLAKERDLTEEEYQERHRLREAYLRAFRGQLRQQLDSVVVEYPDHHREPLRKKK